MKWGIGCDDGLRKEALRLWMGKHVGGMDLLVGLGGEVG